MAGITGILGLQWLAYWRRISRAGAAGKNGLVVLALFTLMGGARYFTVLKNVTAEARNGRFAPLDVLAAGILAVCLAAPLWDEGQKIMSPRELSRFPLSSRARLLARVWGRLIAPISWIAGLFCLSLFLPLLSTAHPFCAAATGAAFLWMSWTAGIVASHLMATARGKQAMTVLFVAIGVSAGVLWLRLGRPSVAAFSWLPSHLLVWGASGSWSSFAALVVLAATATLFAFRSLTWMLETAPATTARKTASARGITLLRKELRYFAGTESMVWLILAAFAFYLATAASPEPDALRAVLMLTSVLTAPAVANSFGPDGAPGLDRYGLWPLTGWQIIATKNRASALLACARWGPILLLACWRFGWREGLYGAAEAASLALASLAWGNITSVRHPSGDDDPGASLTLFDQLVALAASGLPGVLTIAILRRGDSSAPFAMLGMLAVCAGLYAVSLRWAASYYFKNFGAMREWLS